MKKSLLLLVSILAISIAKSQINDRAEAMRLVVKNNAAIGLSKQDLENVFISDSYFNRSAGTRMVYLQQAYRNIPVYNQILVLAFKNDQLVSRTGRFIESLDKRVNIKSAVPVVTPVEAVIAALADRKLSTKQQPKIINVLNSGNRFEFGDLGVSKENITAQLTWVPSEKSASVQLAWQVYLLPRTTADYWMLRVDASNNHILGMDNYTNYCNWDAPQNKAPFVNHGDHHLASEYKFDFMPSPFSAQGNATNSPAMVNNASYRVVPFPAESPSHPGGTPALINNPWTATPGNATSLKWHTVGTTDYNITRGNNVWAQEDRNDNNGIGVAATSTTTPDLTFNFVPNFTVVATQTTPVQNQQFNITNLFYWNNLAHDITYRYGFDEVAGNFQDDNQGRGGAGNDHVNADAQDGGGTNNANFSTPADGQSGRMQMYLWSGSPQKDGDVDNGVIVHEFGHGISNRLTGGPSQSGCLSSAEQMGEGWSDYFCLMYTQDWANSNLNTGFNSPRGIGTYVIGQSPTGSGIRNQKYCTNFAVNNQVYNTTISGESHNRGEIWCATLWDMTWNIINQVGTINPDIRNPTTDGNSIALRLVVEGMRLQPCNPGFIDGRDAIIQADQLLYNGVHECAIREAFRRRGMGAFASQGSAGSVSDQTPDYTAGGASFRFSQNGTTQVPEGGFITYTNTVTSSPCAPVSNVIITDTLPTNVTWISGGTYNSTNRVVSFNVNVAAAQSQDYSFTVQVNAGAYYPTVTLFEDIVPALSIPSALWTTNSTTSTNWVPTNSRSHSAANAYFSEEIDVTSDQKLTMTSAVALGATPPPLSFWHYYNVESTYDGGVLEISTDGGTVWTDLGPNIIKNGYTGTMDASTIIAGRRAWTGSSNNQFIKTKVNLNSYANQNVKIRFRFTSDIGTNPEGWYIDDIAIKDQAVVEMTSNFFTQAGIKITSFDTTTIILPPVSCNSVAVTGQPTATNVCTGSNASFSVTATGDSPTYQWQVSTNGGTSYTDIPGATSASISLTSVTAGMNGNLYQVIIGNTCPSSVTSTPVALTVSDPASITSQPTTFSGCEGTNATFSVTATGTANTYQWQVSTDNGVTFTNLPGATAATLTLNNIIGGMDHYQYHVIISSCTGVPLVSNSVMLNVFIPAAFTTQPSNVTACPSTNAVFSVVANGSTLSYQWQVSTNGGATFTNIAGATSATLTIPNVSAADNNNQYQVIINNTCTGGITSNAVVLSVSSVASINSQPVNTTACVGSPVSIPATASGTAYQWEVSTNGGTTFSPVPGANAPTLDLTNITQSMDGNQYHLVVSTCGPNAITSNNITLTVVTPISVSTQPTGQNACAGSNVSFTVTAAGTNPAYQWEESTDGGLSFQPITGANGPVLNLPGVTVSMNGNQYRLVISNACSVNFTSDAAVLLVSAATAITTQPASQDFCEGSSVTFTATATGAGLSYQWQESTDNGVTYNNISGATSSTLTIAAVTNAMNGHVYRVQVAGCDNVTSSGATLTVYALPVVTITASPYVNLTDGLSTTLTASANPPATSFSWFKNGSSIAGVTGNTLVVNYPDTAEYTASVTDGNNCTGRSSILKIGDSTINIAFIYPNPNNGLFYVRYPGLEFNNKPRIVTVYDAKGSRVLQQSYVIITSRQELAVHGEFLSAGTYAVVLTDSSGNILGTGKVVIRR
ncbi:MAG: M36 family metallopeptidase [Bacteroidetes bacterium]|nr:M36 family metallopeptidase [Bacteroidota bacterium]